MINLDLPAQGGAGSTAGLHSGFPSSLRFETGRIRFALAGPKRHLHTRTGAYCLLAAIAIADANFACSVAAATFLILI